MLDNTTITGSSAGSAKYFEEEDDYYFEGETNNGSWFGKGASELGLVGAVSTKSFSDVLNGRLPNGIVLRRSGVKGSKARFAEDWTFSAPKSVSIQAVLGGDAAVRRAHDAAVKSALGELEKLIDTRTMSKTIRGRENTQSGTFALFQHHLSRASDPQLHTHAVQMNFTKNHKGEYTSVSNERMYKSKALIGAIYRAKLAENLKAAGYELRGVGGNGWELANVSDEKIKLFSKRRKEILGQLDNVGLDGGASRNERQAASMKTRKSKIKVDRSELIEDWKAQLNKAGLSSVEVQQPGATKAVVGDKKTNDEASAKIVDFVISHLMERQGIIEDRQVRKVAYDMSYEGSSVEGIEKALERRIESGLVVRELSLFQTAASMNAARLKEEEQGGAYFKTDDELQKFSGSSWEKITIAGKGVAPDEAKTYFESGVKRGALVSSDVRYTTSEAQGYEMKVLAIEEAGRGKGSAIMSDAMFVQYANKSGMTEEQKNASRLIVLDDNKFSGINGLAGVGKSYLLSETKKIIEEHAKATPSEAVNIIALAPSALQVEDLKAIGLESATLKSFLAGSKAAPRINEKTIILLDEAGLVSAKDMSRLMRIAERKGAKLVSIGDVKQMNAVEAGKPFAQLQNNGMKVAKLENIQRQKVDVLLRAVKAAAAGEIAKAVNMLGGNTRTIKDDGERYTAMAASYTSLSATERKSALIITGTNEARKQINEEVRKSLGMGGETLSALATLDRTRAQIGRAALYKVGDVVVPIGDVDEVIKAGRQYEVHRVAKGKVMLRGDEGELLEFAPNENSPVGLYRKDDIQIAIGDRVRTNMNDKVLGTVNGKMWDVSAVDADAITLKNESGEISLPIVKGLGVFIQHGYTSTAYSAQGLTANSVILDINTNSITSNQASFYVGISRVKNNLKIFANGESGEITDAVARELKKFAALELRNPYLEAKLLDEKIAIVTAKRDKGEGVDLSHAKVLGGEKDVTAKIVGAKSVAKAGKVRVNRVAK